MRMKGQKIGSGLMAVSLLFMGGCAWLTPQPVSPALKPLIVQTPSAENTILEKSLNLGMVWLQPSDGSKTLPEREKDRLFAQIRNHFSGSGMPLKISSVEEVNSIDLAFLRQHGQQQGLTHLLVVAPTIQETIVQEKFGFPRGTPLNGTRTESYVDLEAVALDLQSGSPIFQARGNGQAAHEELEYGAFGPFPRIYRGYYPPGDGSIYFPEGVKEEFPPDEVHIFASKDAMARLLAQLDLVKATQRS